MRIFAALLCVLLSTMSASAQTNASQAASEAARMLEAASVQLDKASTARDRIKALTAAVQAYEAGLAAMRTGLRQASIQELTLERDLRSREAEISQLLGVLQAMSRTDAPVAMLHPSGPTGTARSGMLIAEVTPALAAKASALKNDLEEVTTLRELQQDAANRLQSGLSGLQQARTTLSKAMSDRTDLPRRFTEDPKQTAILIAATESLDGFASGLSTIAENEAPGSLPSIEQRKGTLPWPVRGTILRQAGEADAAGITRPGVILATRPRALVTTPTAATIRYRGPLLDYGLVSILEPQSGILIVLAGLETAYGEPGQVLPAGSPIGLMGGKDPNSDAILSQSGEGAGTDRSETLYIEVREGQTPVDPLAWFSTDKG